MTQISAEDHLAKIRRAVVGSHLYRTDMDALRSAPSDVLDGWAFAREVQPLVKQGVLATYALEREDRTLGNAVSWYFTDEGLRLAMGWLADGGINPKRRSDRRAPCIAINPE